MEAQNGYQKYADITPDLSDKLKKNLNNYTDWKSFCQLLNTKDLTYARASRCLTHILLNLTQENRRRKKHPLPLLRPPPGLHQKSRPSPERHKKQHPNPLPAQTIRRLPPPHPLHHPNAPGRHPGLPHLPNRPLPKIPHSLHQRIPTPTPHNLTPSLTAITPHVATALAA